MYEEKINEMRENLRKLEEIDSILVDLQNKMEWNAMEYVEDDSENGHHYEAPAEGTYTYIRYVAYQEIIKLIAKTYFK